jgi:sulfur carrier protein
MELVVNGEPREVDEGLTIRGLVEAMGLAGGPVAVEVNQAVVPRAQHATHVLEHGDKVEVVHFVGGG